MFQPGIDGLVEFLHETFAGHTPLGQGSPHGIRGGKHGFHAGSSLKDPAPGFARGEQLGKSWLELRSNLFGLSSQLFPVFFPALFHVQHRHFGLGEPVPHISKPSQE